MILVSFKYFNAAAADEEAVDIPFPNLLNSVSFISVDSCELVEPTPSILLAPGSKLLSDFTLSPALLLAFYEVPSYLSLRVSLNPFACNEG